MIEASPFRSFTVSVSLSTNSDGTVIGEMMIGETTTDGKSDELALQGSNLRPPVPKTGVLPTELRAIKEARYLPERSLAALSQHSRSDRDQKISHMSCVEPKERRREVSLGR